MNHLKTLFGKNLKILRKSKEITQEKLAEAIGVEHGQISKIETGRNFPHVENLAKLCFALDCSISELFNFEYGPNIEPCQMTLIYTRLSKISEKLKTILKEELKFELIHTVADFLSEQKNNEEKIRLMIQFIKQFRN